MDWVYRKPNSISVGRKCQLVNVEQHPLLRTPLSAAPSEEKNESFKKTLATLPNDRSNENKLVITSWDGLDPLSAALSYAGNGFPKDKTATERTVSTQKKFQFIGDDFTVWSTYKAKILNKFNTAEKLSIKSSFLVDKSAIKPSVSITQKVKERLDQLDDYEEGSLHEMSNLSQLEYVKRINELNVALNEAWENDQKVKALKIAIQCAKQLSSTNVIHFYPSKFTLINDILDNFGNLVYNRLLNRANDANEDPNLVQETCRNWFYKISSIRELLPRFYIEASILKVYTFLIDDSSLSAEFGKIFIRLTKTIRGIGDPLIAAYCRVYLCRIAIELNPESKIIYMKNIYDILKSSNQLFSCSTRQTLLKQKVEYTVYYSLFTPALEWIFSCLFYKADNTVFQNVLESFRSYSSLGFSGCTALILNSMITCYPASFIFNNLNTFIELIKNSSQPLAISGDDAKSTNTYIFPQYILVKSLGNSLNSLSSVIEFNQANSVLLEVWKIMSTLNSKHEYIACAESWSEIIAKYYSISDLNFLLGDIVANLLPNREFEDFVPALFSTLSKVVQHGSGRFHYSAFFSMSNLMPYLDLFHKENVKMDACKLIVESFIKSFLLPPTNEQQRDISYGNETTSDPIILNLITHLCKMMHDSISALTLEDEKRQISALICGFIRRISFNRDFEAQLNFYVESRANFSNLEHVLSFLVHQVNSLAMETHQIVKGHHTKKTISFVNACIAFSFITIPSIDDIFLQLQLSLASTHIALINVCLPQTDAFLKSAITLLRQLPSHSEGTDGKFYSNDEFLHNFVSQVLSTLIVVPDNPEFGILYLFKGLYNVLKEYNFDAQSNYKSLIWTNMIRYLVNCTLDQYPYHVNKIDSNDTLYAQDEEFLKEIQTYCDIIFQELLDNFKRNQTDNLKRQCNNAIEIINLIISIGHAQSMSHVINQMWNWITKNQDKFKSRDMDAKLKMTMETIKKTFTVNGTGQ